MKTTKIFFAAALSALMLSACSSDDTALSQPAAEGEVAFQLTSSTVQAVAHRAATNLNETKLTSGDVSVFISTNYATQYTYTAQSDGSLTSASTAYYPNDGSEIDIAACYPASASSDASSAATFNVSADQSSDENYIASDLLWAQATGKSKASGSVALAFQHKMAKIIVNVTAGSGVTSIGNITLKNIKRRVSFTASTGVVSAAQEIGGNTDVLIGGNNNAACIPAQTLNGEFLTIVTDQGTATYSFTSSKEVVAGNQYTLNITVNRTNVGTTNTVSDWSSSGTITITPNTPRQTFDVTNNGLITFNVNGVQFTMVGVEGGAYSMTMGSTAVTGSLSDYYIGQTQVTNALWKAVMGSTPSNVFAASTDNGMTRDGTGANDEYPVQQVSYLDICGGTYSPRSTSVAVENSFLYKLNQLVADQLPAGKTFKLPTEVQWNYAAIGGKRSEGYTYAGSNYLEKVAWWGHDGSPRHSYTNPSSATIYGNSGAHTHPVGLLMPNELGLYDMSGNVWEWCQDWYNGTINSGNTSLGANYCNSNEANAQDIARSPYTDHDKVLRGGGWYDAAGGCPVSHRGNNFPFIRHWSFGFRLVLQ